MFQGFLLDIFVRLMLITFRRRTVLPKVFLPVSLKHLKLLDTTLCMELRTAFRRS
jgi:hypothetical protein